MRVIPKAYTGFICGQYMTPNGECLEGVMFYEDGAQQTLFVPYESSETSKLYRALKRLDANVADLIKKTLRVV